MSNDGMVRFWIRDFRSFREVIRAYRGDRLTFQPMLFPFLGQARAIVALVAIATVFFLPACHRTTKEEKSLRADLRQALHEHSYDQAADLAHRILKLQPTNDGTCGSLAQANSGTRVP